MSDAQQRDTALRCADEMRIMASRYRQMGFRHLAKWLERNADEALKWAARKGIKVDSKADARD